jgi:hypothetical protein
LSLRVLPEARPVEPFRWLAPVRLPPGLDPPDLRDVEPPDLVAIESPLKAIVLAVDWAD